VYTFFDMAMDSLITGDNYLFFYGLSVEEYKNRSLPRRYVLKYGYDELA
jgi:hypothetical protein